MFSSASVGAAMLHISKHLTLTIQSPYGFRGWELFVNNSGSLAQLQLEEMGLSKEREKC